MIKTILLLMALIISLQTFGKEFNPIAKYQCGSRYFEITSKETILMKYNFRTVYLAGKRLRTYDQREIQPFFKKDGILKWKFEFSRPPHHKYSFDEKLLELKVSNISAKFMRDSQKIRVVRRGGTVTKQCEEI